MCWCSQTLNTWNTWRDSEKNPKGHGKNSGSKPMGKNMIKYAKISKNRNKLWVNMTNGLPTYLLTRGGCECSHGNLKSINFVSSLFMFSLDILHFNIFLENYLNGSGIIFGNYLLPFTPRVSSIKWNEGTGSHAEDCVRFGSSWIPVPLRHLFSWLRAQRKTMSLNGSYRPVVSMIDLWSCMVKV